MLLPDPLHNRATIYPDRIAITPIRTVDIFKEYERKLYRENKYVVSDNSLNNLTKPKTNINLSKSSIREIKNTVNFLSAVTTPKTIQINSKKYIYNFKCSFITLTLPSKQKHTDIEIKKTVLNNFLNNIRNTFKVKNYVWVSEIQKNGNIHFHFILDSFIHYSQLRHYWNRSLELLGYVTAYQNDFKGLSLQEYASRRKVSIKEALQGFRRGVKTNWRNPQTENVKPIKQSSQLAAYVSKYITKQNKADGTNSDRAETWGRSWGRSTSLAKIKFQSNYNIIDIFTNLNAIQSIKEYAIKKVFDYCTVIYFNFTKMNKGVQQYLNKKMQDLADMYNYIESQPHPHQPRLSL